ncbi:carbohydrate kinase [Kribbella sp. VKM Ac-2568]|uniref:carbohydrate kinase family protein n=1 Tax=Kribbella sp. VKM Ac-2568 TaxID=2512219 RepID=UPI0010481446|nr:carbohydrate kinase [Kribbella sp. VKM Ac-2568]TCM47869.1 fructokinase [Kribbella sp. VKM Ac-2568]
MTAPVLVIGEALVDIVGAGGRSNGSGSGRNGRHGTKATPGGSPANVAVGLARLGLPTELVTRFGTDPYGDQLGAHLFGNGVQLAPGSVDPHFRTSTATATLDGDGVASYQFDITWEPPALSLSRGCPAVHTGSIATVLEPGAEAIRRFLGSLAEQPVTVTLDPNARPTITPDAESTWAAVRGLAALADLVKLSDEDCEFLRPGATPDEIAAELLAVDRTRCVVITRGGEGAIGMSRTARVEVAAPAIKVIDTVGAGDSFMSALIAGLHTRGLLGEVRLEGLDEENLSAVVDYAVKAAAITCTRHGADPPTAAEHKSTWG